MKNISTRTGVNEAEVRNYLSMNSEDKKKASAQAGSIAAKIKNEIARSGRTGLLSQYRDLFINNARDSWKQGMYEGGYGPRIKKLMTRVKNQGKAGRQLGDLDYEALFFNAIKPGSAGPDANLQRQGTNLIEWPDIETEEDDEFATWMPTGIFSR